MRKIRFVKTYKIWLSLAFLLSVLLGSAQNIELSSNTLVGSKDQLPFWLWANQLGRYNKNNNAVQNFELNAFYSSPIKQSHFAFQGGTSTNIIISNNNELLFTELFGGLSWKFIELKAGAFAEKEMYNGLSASNGNLAYSQNARPHPRIRIGLDKYVPLFFSWMSIYCFYEEGKLNDTRYVNDTHLHHKSIYLRLGEPKSIQLTGGLEHYVMWGGTHPVFGELPGWEDYFSIITAGESGENAPITEQKNAQGNSFGTYQVELKKNWTNLGLSFYLSHPFEDKSGLQWKNWRDNLYGLFINFPKENSFIESLALEYYYSKHQSGKYHLHLNPDGTYSGAGADNYYNHLGVYNSGVTYQQMSMASPIFAPVITDDNKSLGFENNRLSGIHLGLNGTFTESLQWRTLLTYTSNFGVYRWDGSSTYTRARNQFSSRYDLAWQIPRMPLLLGASLAVDQGHLFDEGVSTLRFGGMLSLKWHLFP